MKIIDTTDWPQEERDKLHREWNRGTGFGVGPMPPEDLDSMLADGVLDDANAIPGLVATGYRYTDDQGASLRVIIAPEETT